MYFPYFILSPLEKGGALHLYKLESPSSKDALCQVWLKLTQRFWRRSWKCEKFTTTTTTPTTTTTTTDKGQILIRKAHFDSGELKTCTCECLFISQKFSETSKNIPIKMFYSLYVLPLWNDWHMGSVFNLSFLNQGYRYCASSLKKPVKWFLLQSLSVESLKTSVRVERPTNIRLWANQQVFTKTCLYFWPRWAVKPNILNKRPIGLNGCPKNLDQTCQKGSDLL